MTETAKVSNRLTDEQKAGINKMIADKAPHRDIIKKFKVSSGTVSSMAKKLSNKSTTATEHKDSNHVAALKESLVAIRNRKALVDEMLNGSLKQELEQLTIAEENLEKTIDSIIQLEAFTKNK